MINQREGGLWKLQWTFVLWSRNTVRKQKKSTEDWGASQWSMPNVLRTTDPIFRGWKEGREGGKKIGREVGRGRKGKRGNVGSWESPEWRCTIDQDQCLWPRGLTKSSWGRSSETRWSLPPCIYKHWLLRAETINRSSFSRLTTAWHCSCTGTSHADQQTPPPRAVINLLYEMQRSRCCTLGAWCPLLEHSLRSPLTPALLPVSMCLSFPHSLVRFPGLSCAERWGRETIIPNYDYLLQCH